uniref:Uncharacterized protein n=1 Tax=Helianthus annuus TaxID=4232 RepID=A0A251TGP8_HELAN
MFVYFLQIIVDCVLLPRAYTLTVNSIYFSPLSRRYFRLFVNLKGNLVFFTLFNKKLKISLT